MPCSPSNPLPGLTADQIAKWADRIAAGRDEFPADLSEPDRSALADAVRGRLRDRLLRLAAQAVAHRVAEAPSPPSRRKS
jgi:hypothetical protein